MRPSDLVESLSYAAEHFPNLPEARYYEPLLRQSAAAIDSLANALRECVDTYAIEEVHAAYEDCGCLASVVLGALYPPRVLAELEKEAK